MLANGWPPFDVVRDGRVAGVSGLSGDLLHALVGPDVVIEAKTFPDMTQLLAAACAGQVDVLMSIARTPERERCVSFTAPYFRASASTVVRRDDHRFVNLAGLATARIAIERGFARERLLRDGLPRASIVTFATTREALAAVLHGDADAYIGFAPVVHVELASEAFRGLRVAFEQGGKALDLRFGVPRERIGLRDQLNRALRSLNPAEAAAIRARWLSGNFGAAAASAASGLTLGTEETQPIQQKWSSPAAPNEQVWSVSALHLLPVLIGIGSVLLVTLRAYVLLQREVRLRKRTERELALQLNFQQTMMKTVPYPLAAKDLDGRYIAVNEAYEKACGMSRGAVVGRTTAEVGTWGDANGRKLDDMTRELLRGGTLAQVELQFEDTAGEPRHGLFWTRVCHGDDGQPVCVLGTMVDITDIRRAEMLARETERRLFDVTRSLPAVVFQLRRTANGAYSFPYIGGDSAHLLGEGSASLVQRGQVDFQRISELDRAFVLAELERSAMCETPVHMEFRLANTNVSTSASPGAAANTVANAGQPKWVRAELVPRREADGGVVWSGYWVDASVERARSEELARARDFAEAASRAKDRFFAMMSHEIRTPMNGVLGLAEVLERTALSTDQSEMLGMIHESAGALLQILDDLLDYSKIEAGHLTIEAEPIDLRELVDNAVGLLAGRAHENGLKVRVEIAAGVAATLCGDSVRLRQILFNLLGNAIKFTPNGEVGVSVAVVADRDALPGSTQSSAQTLEITVHDTGIGIAPDVQASLFEPFVQAESSTTRRFGGTGLGLTICRKLIELMNGTLTLRSEPGGGTFMTVRLTMPVVAQHYSVSALRGKRGVVIARDPCIARAVTHFGEALGLELQAVLPDGGEASVAAARPAPGERVTLAGADLLFISEDIALPGHIGANTRIVTLTEKPKPTGYRILDDTVRVSVNPILWRGFSAACAAAMTRRTPLAPRAPEHRAAPPDREREMASGRLILVAEDHPVNQELIRHQLALLGFACDVADDGVEALAALERTNYGCLITDCHMPNLSGYELTRRIREAEAARARSGAHRLPILGITANTAPDDLILCREAGMDDTLIKPTRLATLRDHLSRWFGAEAGIEADAERASQAAPTETLGNVPPAPDIEGPAVRQTGATPPAPIDLAHMTQLWGSESTVKALLDSFVSSMRDDMRTLASLLEHVEIARMLAWQHRVAGAANVLQYPPLIHVLEAYREQIVATAPERMRAEGFALIEKCEAMLDSIEQRAALLA